MSGVISKASHPAMRRWLLVGGAIIAMACDRGESAPAASGRGGPNGGQARVVPVAVAVAELGTAARTVSASGAVEPLRTVAINSQLGGALLSVNVEEGSRVSAGTVLARIDSRELSAQLAAAEAALEAATRAADRAQQLFDQQIVTAAEYERDQTAASAARASRDQLRTRIGYATVRSPIAGVVLRKQVERGDVVSANMEMFTVADISALVVRVPISELDVTGLDVGDDVEVTLDALPGRRTPGRIRRIFPSADTLTRLVPVEIELRGAATRDIRPGFLARVTFSLDPRGDVLLVPASAVVDAAAGAAVFRVKDGTASRTSVRRGDTYQGRVEILSGLSPGDTIVIAGNQELRDGASVRISELPSLEGQRPSLVPSDSTRGLAAPVARSAP